MTQGWTVTFPKELLQYIKLLDAFVLEAPNVLMIDGANFPDAIAITGTREMPPVLERLGLYVNHGVIPELHQRPKFDPRVVWVATSAEVGRQCNGTFHVGPWERISKDQMETCTACGAVSGK